MRQDELEVIAATIAGDLVVELVRLTGAPLPAGVTQALAARARRLLTRELARASALRVDASTATYADLRKR